MSSNVFFTGNSKSMVVPTILKGNNYLLWSRTIKTVLSGKGLWKHIGTKECPKKTLKKKAKKDEEPLSEEEIFEALEEELEKWEEDQQATLGLLYSSIDQAILEAYSYCNSPKELWDTLKSVYGNTSNLSRIFEIKKSINDLQQDGKGITDHLGKFQTLWSELEMLRPATGSMAVLEERRKQDKVFGFLLTLDSVYNDFIKHVLREDELPSMEDVCAKLQKEEGNIGLFGGKSELVTANKGVFKNDKRGACDHCKKGGHTKDECWILHPQLKPEWAKEKEKNYRNKYKANVSRGEEPKTSNASSSHEVALAASVDYVRKSDLEAIVKALQNHNTGTTFFSHKPSSKLVVDSGASHHMISNPKFLDKIQPAIGRVEIANGDGIPIEGKGNLNLFNKKSEAFYVPKFKSNLLSVKRTTKDLNCYAIFSPNDVHFQDIDSGKLLGKGGTKDELYILEETPQNSDALAFKSCYLADVDAMWHARLGHPHERALKLMLPNMSFDHTSCEACILGKHCKVVFPKSSTIYEHCFDLVHSDVWTSPCISRDKNKYFVTFIDEKSKYTWVTLLPSKDRVFEAFINFQNYVTNQYNAKIKVFRSDNGGEYTSTRFKEHLAKHGILHQTSCPHTPQQNGVAERKNRHLMEVARSMMFYANVPKSYWGDAVLAACYLINRIPTKVLMDISPFEVLTKTKPSLNHLRVFGCVCFVHVPGDQRNKLEAKSTRCMFIGYSTTQKGYKCYDPLNNRLLVSREVKFIEDQGYYGKKNWEELKDLSQSPSDQATCLRYLLSHLGNGEPSRQGSANGDTSRRRSNSNLREEDSIPIMVNEDDREGEQPQIQEQEDLSIEEEVIEPQEDVEEDMAALQHDVETTVEETSQPIRQSTRPRFPSKWVDNKIYYNNQAVAHPIQAVCSIALLPSEHQAFLSKIEQHFVPKTYDEVKDEEVWVEAIGDERGAMEKNHTWDVEALPKGKKTVSSKWVFTIKYKSNGDIERYKARLVARGFTQTYGEDYTDTFAPVAKLHTVRVVLSLATNLSWDLWQMDVKNAFLQGELEEEVYMTPPPGLEDLCAPGQVLRLRKAIYGLKQSPRAWYHKLSSTLLDHGFKKSHSDHTLFTLQSTQGIVVVLVYVDDLIISGNDKEGIKATKAFLNSTFDIKDLGELKYFLGLEVYRSEDGLFLSQRKYALELLEETGMMGSKPAKTPLEDGYKVNRKGEKSDEKYKDVSRYRRMVGKLIYLTLTRPDLCFAVNQVSQHMQEPTIYHWSMVERILRYIKGSPGQGIWMGKNGNTEIVGYCDADWAGDRIDRKSTTGYCTFVGGNLVTWKTKKQKVVSCSSAEAEYRAMRKLTNELTWLKALLKDFGIEREEPITMHCDNQAAIHIATNSVFHERTKHIEIDCHKVREKIEEGVILPCYTRSEDQLADIFTKAASLKVCNRLFSKLGLVDPTHP